MEGVGSGDLLCARHSAYVIQGHSSQSILLRSLHIRYCDTKFPELDTDMQETRESIPVCVARVGFAFSLLPSNTALLQTPALCLALTDFLKLSGLSFWFPKAL